MFSLPRLARATPLLRRPPHGAARCVSQQPAPAPAREMDAGERAIHDKLTARLTPTQLLVQDVSGGCGTFYAITVASGAFAGLPVVRQHRLVTDALRAEIADIHGLQIKTIAE